MAPLQAAESQSKVGKAATYLWDMRGVYTKGTSPVPFLRFYQLSTGPGSASRCTRSHNNGMEEGE